MQEITRVGVDLAKQIIQVHAVDGSGKLVTSRALARDKFMAWCAQLPPDCMVAMEAGSGAHHWAREFAQFGHTVRLMAPKFVAPYCLSVWCLRNTAPGAKPDWGASPKRVTHICAERPHVLGGAQAW